MNAQEFYRRMCVAEIGRQKEAPGEDYFANIKADLRDAQRERVAEKIEETITELCNEFVWDSALDHNRTDVKEMIRGALKGKVRG